MAVWRRPVRFALVLFVVGLGLMVLFSLRDRADPIRSVVVERADPEAIIQTRGSRIIQTDSLGDNFRVVAARQLTYPDGGLKMIDGVEVTVDSREDREGFTLSGTEASVAADQTEVTLSGSVRFSSSNGLEATTDSALYSRADGIVRMPNPASFLRTGMEASASHAEYDRTGDLLRLFGGAAVILEMDPGVTIIVSQVAAIAQTDGFMTFEDAVKIDADAQQMTAAQAHVSLIEGSSRPDTLELHGGARILGTSVEPGELREMTAADIRLDYGEDSGAIEQATLDGVAGVELFGSASQRGTQIGGRAIDVAFTEEGQVGTLWAQDEVVLEVPATGGQPAQRVISERLQATSGFAGTLERAVFDGEVEYRETHGEADAREARVVRATRLETTLADGLSSIDGATFYGDVTFTDDAIEGHGDQVHYVVTENAVELISVGPAGQVPRVVERRGSVRAETIRLDFEGPRIDAQGSVDSVLSHTNDGDGESDVRRPGLLDDGDPVLVTAEKLAYDGEAGTATYRGAAHLWQGDTEFRGNTIVLDETTGNLEIEGAAQTRFLVTQINDDTGLPEESLTTGAATSMHYADDLRRVTYTTSARLTGPRADLRADVIEVDLHADSNSLDRITASGDVILEMTGRQVSGQTLVYYDADGRYEMGGEPVRIVEEGDDECRETTGRTITFFITADEVSVDGQAEARTESAGGECSELMSR